MVVMVSLLKMPISRWLIQLLFSPEPHRNGAEREPLDPTQGFHPLVSMYYLAREKLERDRVYGPGQFASSQLSVLGDLSVANASSALTPTDEKSPSTRNQPPSYAKATPAPSPSRKDPVPNTKAKADYSVPLPGLPAPETSHYSGMSYDTTAPSPTAPTFAVPNTPTPRARDPGAGLPVPPSPTVPASTVTSNATTTTTTPTTRQHVEIDQSATIAPKRGVLPRAPPPSTHRRSHSMSQRPTIPMLTTRWGGMFGSGHHATDEHGKVIPEPPKTVGPDTSNFPISPVTGEKDRHHDHSAFSGGATLVRKFGSLLVGGGDGSRRHHAPAKRATILDGMTPTTSTMNGATDEEKAVSKVADKEGKDETTAPNARPSDHPPPPPPLTTTIHTTPPSPTSSPVSTPPTPRKSVMPPFATTHRRAATILDPQGRAIRHERRSSTGAAFMGNASSSLPGGGTVGRSRRPSTGYSTSGRPLAERLFRPKTSEPLSAPAGGTEGEMAEKKEDEDESGAQSAGEVTDREEDDRNTVKPVFLKGLFRFAFFPLISKLDLTFPSCCIVLRQRQRNNLQSSRPISDVF